jgi:diketogulonate reductase-like aldo/keto reductase
VELSRASFLLGSATAMGFLALGHPAQGQSAGATMQTRPIPSTGAPLPVIGCGTWRTFDTADTGAERTRLGEVLRVLFESGGSVIDTSPMYGRAESVVGDLLAAARSRDRAFIATKVWTSGKAAGVAQMEQSLRLLWTERVELIQVHNLLDWRTHLATLRGWKRDGRIRYLGVTHYTASAYGELEKVMREETLDFVQLDYAIDDRGAEARLLPLAADRGIAVLVNQPFGGGRLLRALAGRPLPDWAAEIDCQHWSQVLLKFVLAHPAVTCVIPGTSRPEHMRENALAGRGRLPDAALRVKMVAAVGA